MVACLFARNVYTPELLGECLQSVGYRLLADRLEEVSSHIQQLRWVTRFATGYDPTRIDIPKRFKNVITRKGPIDNNYLNRLKDAYAEKIIEIARQKTQESGRI
jgi:aldehyde:ferredoxin oxidoreductase